MDYQEFWLPIEGCPHYEVSNFGDIRRGDRLVRQHKNRRGWLIVSLSESGVLKTFSVARIVHFTFSNSDKSLQVNHISGYKDINIATNLEATTCLENVKHAIEHNLFIKGVHCGVEKPVNQYSIDGKFIAEYPSAKIAGEKTGAYRSQITACCKKRGIIKESTAGGFKWSYAKEPVVEKKYGPTKTMLDSYKNYEIKVDKYGLDGTYLGTFDSLKKAAATVNGSSGNIWSCCRGTAHTAYGFKWKYTKDR